MSVYFGDCYSRTLPRGFVGLCTVALALFVGSTRGSAAVYDVHAVEITVENTFYSAFRSSQVLACAARGGVLVPDVSDTVHLQLLNKVQAEGVTRYYGYLGGSTLLSSTACTESTATLDCIWYWDQGRYSGLENAYPFYKGNYLPDSGGNGGLEGAGMISTTSGNYWLRRNNAQAFPGIRHQRYAMLALLPTDSKPGWVDSSDTSFSYGQAPTTLYYAMCLVERAATTTTTTTTTTIITTTPTTLVPEATTLNEPGEREATATSVATIVGFSVAAALVVGLVVALITYKARRKGCCCFAVRKPTAVSSMTRSPAVDSPTTQSSNSRVSRRSGLSSDSSFRSRGSHSISERSFHAAAPNRDGSRRSLIHWHDYENAVGYLDSHGSYVSGSGVESLASDELNLFSDGDVVLLPDFQFSAALFVDPAFSSQVSKASTERSSTSSPQPARSVE
ncbi:hypothetical protein JKF63_03227 [Porcisia hertigi]|uniref:Uncharacterized protein n=1 Tax=Porcisia hertigi TaxID=2761500 RepID=A0A836I1V0_9TRYP|nr:hypothetical protein JKF63_03227 [Porcisia hertigi]